MLVATMPRNATYRRFAGNSAGARNLQAVVLRLALAVLFVVFSQYSAAALPQNQEVRRVLIFNDLSSVSSPGFGVIDQAIYAVLEKSPYRIELYNENLETTLFPDQKTQQSFREWFIHKYAERQPDVIIAVGGGAIQFMVDSHEVLFPGVPVIFCGSMELESLNLDSHFTGVWATANPAKTIDAALRLRPSTRRVVVVGGMGRFDREMESVVKRDLAGYQSKIEIAYWTDFDMPTLLHKLAGLQKDVVVYHTSLTEDARGAYFIDATQSVPAIARAASAPVFVVDGVDIGQGTVGGYVTSWAADGRVAATMASRVLNGERPQDIAIVRDNNFYIFDWRAIKRWGLKEADLPPGSTILFRERSPWEAYNWIWISLICAIVLLSALSAYLQYSRSQLKQARDTQRLLSRMLINAQEKERSRLAAELHDDFSQRLAFLSLGLENVMDALPASAQCAKEQLNSLTESASELGADLHTVSHRLHPASLESLGLVPGVTALCREFTARQGIKVDFTSRDIPRNVPPNVALCLFRIVQEGLQNLKKHSGALEARVTLCRVGNTLHLSVCDEGAGFNLKESRYNTGLGIQSMGERARLLGGHFEIHSQPGKGTKVEASVPLCPESLVAPNSEGSA